MALLFQLLTFAAIAAATGAVAALVLLADARRPWNQWLAFFLALVCGNYAAQALNRAAFLGPTPDLDLARLADGLAYAFLAFDPAVLAYFASIFPRRGGLATRPWGLPLIAAPALVFLLGPLLAGDPGLLGQQNAARYAFLAYMGACYLYAGWRVLASYLGEPSRVMADQLRVVALGFLVAVVSRVALLGNDLQPAFAIALGGFPYGEVTDLAVRLAVLWALFLGARTLAGRPGVEAARRREASGVLGLTGLVFALFSAVWVAQILLQLMVRTGILGGPALNDAAAYLTHGLIYTVRWFVFAAAMVHGVVRYQALGVRLPSAAAASLLVAGASGVVLLAAATEALGPWLGALVGVPAVLALVLGAQRLAARRGPRGSASAYLHERRLEVYRALLAAALAQGPLGPERERELAASRARLGLTEREHAALLAIAQAEEGAAPEGVLLGRYELLRRLGAGGYATVYLARDRELGGLVVLKRLRRDVAGPRGALGSSLRELEVARRVSHPNMVAVHDVVRLDDGALVVMEFVEGGSLRDALARRRALPAAEVARLVEQALLGLQAVHEAGLVHGDVKPENLLLTADGGVKLADFGAARAADPARTLVQGTGAGPAAGTLASVSGSLSPRTDLQL